MWWLLGLGVVLCLAWTAYNIATAGGDDADTAFLREEAHAEFRHLMAQRDPADRDPDGDHHAMHYTDS